MEFKVFINDLESDKIILNTLKIQTKNFISDSLFLFKFKVSVNIPPSIFKFSFLTY